MSSYLQTERGRKISATKKRLGQKPAIRPAGWHHSASSRQLMSRTRKGRTPWNRGKHGVMPTPWNKGKCGVQSAWNKGLKGVFSSPRKGITGLIKHTEATKRRMSEAHRKRLRQNGFINSPETRKKISQARILRKQQTGYLNSPVTRQRISERNSGERHPFWGKHRSDETKRRIGAAQIGVANHAWKGGSSFAPYSVDWTEQLRRSIRQRDKYTCQADWCRREPAVDVHHIDYDKQNCDPANLITLCHSCHIKTNHNREAWFNYFLNHDFRIAQ